MVCLGEAAYSEKKGDIKQLDLNPGLAEVVKNIRNVADNTTPIVLALVEGRPRLLGELPRLVSAREGKEGG